MIGQSQLQRTQLRQSPAQKQTLRQEQKQIQGQQLEQSRRLMLGYLLLTDGSDAMIERNLRELEEEGIVQEDVGLLCEQCQRNPVAAEGMICPDCMSDGTMDSAAERDPDEMELDDDLPVDSADEDSGPTIPFTPNPAEIFAELLVAGGWPLEQVESDARSLASIRAQWERDNPFPMNEDELRQAVTGMKDGEFADQSIEESTQTAIEETFLDLRQEADRERTLARKPQITILRDGEEYRVEIWDYLEGLRIIERWNSKIDAVRDRNVRLQMIGEMLVRCRLDFFEARNETESLRILREHSLSRTEFAEAIKEESEGAIEIKEQSLSRYAQSVWVQTPHGVFALRDFFSNPVAGGGGFTREGVLARILEARHCMDAGSVKRYLADTYGFLMNDRTYRDYQRSARIVDAIWRAWDRGVNDPEEILEDLMDCLDYKGDLQELYASLEEADYLCSLVRTSEAAIAASQQPSSRGTTKRSVDPRALEIAKQICISPSETAPTRAPDQ